ncbi:MAG: glutamate--cysteine ligase, partial [Desulfuromonadales bacterium]|nr:glutamate--cysteine ligase [Desulfuromonadales bacterium]
DMREGSRLIGLQGPHSSITLEPGGQFELSGQLCVDLFCNCRDFNQHIAKAVEAGEKLGLILLGLGTQPFSRLDEIEWTPKTRYDIMGPYMQKSGDMGQRMMKQSAGFQVNLDFSDEADCMRKLRLAQALAPLLYGLFANSPIMDGQPTGFLTTRGEIWSRTDPDRTGLLSFLDNPNAGFTDYVEYALDVPMYFINRNGEYLDLTQRPFTFREFLDSGHAGHQASMSDWDLHLSTLFPEVRLRPQIEVRSADSLPPHLVLAVAALLKGLMYDEESFQSAWEHCQLDSTAEIEIACRQAWRQGLQAPWKGGTLQDLARICLALARNGLDQQKSRKCQERSECHFLKGLDTLIEGGDTLAEQLLQKWQGNRQEKLKALIEHCGFFDIPPRPSDCAEAQIKTDS